MKIRLIILAMSVIIILLTYAFTTEQKKTTVFYFNKDLNKVGQFIDKWHKLGYKIDVVTSQPIAIGNIIMTSEGNLFVVMSK